MRQGWRLRFFLQGLALAVLLAGLSACAKGPFSPEARQQSASYDQYMAVLKGALVTDDTFTWKTLSSALIVRALPYSPEVRQAAEARFADDPEFAAETTGWLRLPQRNLKPLVVLMGIFAPDLSEKDITQLGRFRPRLLTPDGRLLSPVEIKRYGRDKVFMRDHFPIFNPWEEVYLVKFPVSGRGWAAGSLTYQLQWPGGVQTLILNPDQPE